MGSCSYELYAFEHIHQIFQRLLCDCSYAAPKMHEHFSNVINSIFESAAIDTCMGRIALSWNSYPSLPEKVIGYSVLSSVGGGNYSEAGTLSAADTSFTLNEFTFDAEYCFVVRANLANGQSSASKKSCLSTRMQRTPDWIDRDQATINSDGKIALSFTIDPLSEINHFSLSGKPGQPVLIR